MYGFLITQERLLLHIRRNLLMKKSRLLEELLMRMRNDQFDGGYDPNVTIQLMSKETWYKAGSQQGRLNKGGMYSLYYNENFDEFMLVEDDSHRFIYEYKEFVDDYVFSKLLEQFIVKEERNYYSYLRLPNSKQINVGEQVNPVSIPVISFIESRLPYTKFLKTWTEPQSKEITQVVICSSNIDDLDSLSDFFYDTFRPFHKDWDSVEKELDKVFKLDIDIMEYDV